jgi:hypothetical protein
VGGVENICLREVGRYGCQNDGLDEADMMGRGKKEEGGSGGREGGREGGSGGRGVLTTSSSFIYRRSGQHARLGCGGT